MKKSMIHMDGSALGIRPDVIKRIVCKQNWWLTAPRVFDYNDCTPFSLSYPDDYIPGRKMINYEFEETERLAQCS